MKGNTAMPRTATNPHKVVTGKRRGRPPGSKNKPKVTAPIQTVSSEVVIPHQGILSTLIGFADKRAGSLSASESARGYNGPVPIADALKTVFSWKAVEGELVARVKNPAGRGRPLEFRDPSRKVIVRQDTGKIFGVFSDRYKLVNHNEWFNQFVVPLLGEHLQVGACGTLEDGAIAWASIEQTNSSKVADVTFRSSLFAVTSLDGSLSTMYHLLVNNMVCDNFMAPKPDEVYYFYNRQRSTRNREPEPLTAEQASEMIKTTTTDFKASVESLCNETVTQAEWSRFLDLYVPIPAGEGRGATRARNVRDAIETLYKSDPRVAPWAGTAYGVVACINTYKHHESQIRSAERVERTLARAAKGQVQLMDNQTLVMLDEAKGNK